MQEPKTPLVAIDRQRTTTTHLSLQILLDQGLELPQRDRHKTIRMGLLVGTSWEVLVAGYPILPHQGHRTKECRLSLLALQLDSHRRFQLAEARMGRTGRLPLSTRPLHLSIHRPMRRVAPDTLPLLLKLGTVHPCHRRFRIRGCV